MKSMAKKREEVIKFITSQKIVNRNMIYLDHKCFNTLKGITQQDFTLILLGLQEDGYLTVTFMTQNENNPLCRITFTDKLFSYFEKKRNSKAQNAKSKFIELFKWLIPLIVSILALIISYIAITNHDTITNAEQETINAISETSVVSTQAISSDGLS